MKIAVADMTDNGAGRGPTLRRRALFPDQSASREIGTQTSVATRSLPAAASSDRPIDVMARLPKAGSLFGPVAQADGPPPNRACNLLDAFQTVL